MVSSIDSCDLRIELATEVRRFRSRPTADEESSIQKRRAKLQKDIDAFNRESTAYIPQAVQKHLYHGEPCDLEEVDEWEEVADDELDVNESGKPHADTEVEGSVLPPEKTSICL